MASFSVNLLTYHIPIVVTMGEFVESSDFDFTQAFGRHYFFTNAVDDQGLEGVVSCEGVQLVYLG